MSPESVNQAPGAGDRRPYRAPRRAQQAAETRRRLRDAAELLFLERGFTGTTTKAIAEAAGVSEKTVFLAFPSKAALLSEIIRHRVRGDEESETRAVDSEAWQRALAAPDDELLPTCAAHVTQMLVRSAAILAVAEAAAAGDHELAARRELGHASSRATVGSIVETLSARGILRPDVPVERAKDELFALTSEAVFLRLTAHCGWQPAEYSDWLAAIAAASLMRRT